MGTTKFAVHVSRRGDVLVVAAATGALITLDGARRLRGEILGELRREPATAIVLDIGRAVLALGIHDLAVIAEETTEHRIGLPMALVVPDVYCAVTKEHYCKPMMASQGLLRLVFTSSSIALELADELPAMQEALSRGVAPCSP